jgi:hypothetical protein
MLGMGKAVRLCRSHLACPPTSHVQVRVNSVRQLCSSEVRSGVCAMEGQEKERGRASRHQDQTYVGSHHGQDARRDSEPAKQFPIFTVRIRQLETRN